jgi:hypothetical protein
MTHAINATTSVTSTLPVPSINAPIAWSGNPGIPSPTVLSVVVLPRHHPFPPPRHPRTTLQVLLDRLPIGSLYHVIEDLIEGHMGLTIMRKTPTLIAISLSTKLLRTT